MIMEVRESRVTGERRFGGESRSGMT